MITMHKAMRDAVVALLSTIHSMRIGTLIKEEELHSESPGYMGL